MGDGEQLIPVPVCVHRTDHDVRTPQGLTPGSRSWLPPNRLADGEGVRHRREAYAERMLDAEAMLRGASRPLVLGMGGGGDVVGALATAEHGRLYDGWDPVLGGLSWERRPIDPVPGPRTVSEIADAEELAPGVMLAGAETRVRGRDVFFAESRMAQFLAQQTILIDVTRGPAAIASSLGRAVALLNCDLVVFVDVGGDVLADGQESGLRSPLCDALMLAVAERMRCEGQSVLAGVFGIGCDAELTPSEVLARIAKVASAGGLCGARGLTAPVADRLEGAIALVPTEASAQAVHAFRGAHGMAEIRGGARELELSPAAALTMYLDVAVMIEATGRLARAVDAAAGLEEANEALHEIGVRTELDLERNAARTATASNL